MFITKQRIYNFDLIRAVSAWLIVICHYAEICIITPQFADFPFFFTYANGKWGETTVVTIFFMLSGASLYYNHPEVKLKECKKFFFARWKGIFPMFYLLWLFLYYQRVVDVKNFLYQGNPKYLLLSFLGMDGYLNYRYPNNYYFIGEWFLGALILLYVCYPLLTWCMKHCKIVTTIVLGAGFLFLFYTQFFLIQKERNLITCLLSFWLGMLFIEYKELLIKKWLTIVAAIGACIFIFVPLPINSLLCMQANAVCLFLVLYALGGYVMKCKPVGRFISYSGKISYGIFLLQHIVMSEVIHIFDAYNMTVLQETGVLLLTFIVIYIFATVLLVLNKALMNTAPMQKIQGYFNQ